jgi:hypothetical protein
VTLEIVNCIEDMLRGPLNSYSERTPAGCYLASYLCKLVSLICLHYMNLSLKFTIHKDTYHCHSKKDGILFKLYGTLFLHSVTICKVVTPYQYIGLS